MIIVTPTIKIDQEPRLCIRLGGGAFIELKRPTCIVMTALVAVVIPPQVAAKANVYAAST
jgi:hypothetical protein